ncbi:dolichol-P-glucose synthetase [Thermococcus chitonophagus]|uniref:Dolichol-P-glucose synthetase n=1 Tax=Thermococcus chitonophagus TaxID=54262 RepID=A0A160VUG5_9EURY|nr:dolichol-P-glucose synthetase [Thermococcus chitonophagus]CUX77311.1 dolichol-P-glucose synthetase, putative [Thermococcus chitonophagus]
MDVSVILPTMNEEEAIKAVLPRIKEVLEDMGVEYEIIVVDKSQDRTPEIAQRLGAKVIRQRSKGYGGAYLEGFKVAKGKYIVMMDPDGSYPPEDIPRLLEPLMKDEADLVICTRLKGKILPGAMPWLHRYIGNPLLTKILDVFFKTNVSDAHCGMRAFKREVLERLNLKCRGMEFASEMIIEAVRAGLRIKEVPITYYPRIGKSKLHSLKDGWRHLRLMLLYSPTYLFLIPGILIIILGIALMIYAYNTNPFRVHTMILGSLLAIVGLQVLNFGISAKVYAVKEGFSKPDELTEFFMRYSILEEGLALGGFMIISGFLLGLWIFYQWYRRGYGELYEVKAAILVLTLIAVGLQVVFFSFFISIFMLKEGFE